MIPNEEVREKFLMHTRRKDFLNSVSIFGMYATMIGYTQCDDYIDQLNDYIKENMKIVEEFIKEELPDFKFKNTRWNLFSLDCKEMFHILLKKYKML